MVDAVANRHDAAGDLPTGHDRVAGWMRVGADPHHRVAPIATAIVGVDDDLAGAGRGIGQVLHDDVIDTARLDDYSCFHAACSPSVECIHQLRKFFDRS